MSLHQRTLCRQSGLLGAAAHPIGLRRDSCVTDLQPRDLLPKRTGDVTFLSNVKHAQYSSYEVYSIQSQAFGTAKVP